MSIRLKYDAIVNTRKGQCSLTFSAQSELASDGNEVKEHTDPDSINYLKLQCDTELVFHEN